MKGQRSRSGARFQPRVREILKRYPKLRGYKRAPYGDVISLNVGVLERHFAAGDTVNPTVLLAKHIINTEGKKVPTVKILGSGELTKKITLEKCAVSALAKEKIEKAGGSIM
jgi:large subunit ribosomal protein L15